MRKRGVAINGQRRVQPYQCRGWSQQELPHKSGLDVRTIPRLGRGEAAILGPCTGTWAAPGQRQLKDLVGQKPFLFPDGSAVAWHNPQSQPGAYYQLSWEW